MSTKKQTKKQLAAIALGIALWGAATAGYADTIILKSGDIFTGTITNIGPDTIDVNTSFAGSIHVKRDTIKTLRSDNPVTIVSADGSSHKAFVSQMQTGTGWSETPAAAPVIPAPVIALVPPPPTPKAPKAFDTDLERYFIPVGPHWKNEFVLGIVNTTGNTDSTNISSEVDLHYKDKPSELTLKLGGNYNVTNGAQTAGQFYLDSVYRRTLPEWDKSERWYIFGENHELYDAIKGISLRSTTSGGLGYFLFKGDKFSLDLRAGPAYVYERDFNGQSTSSGSALVGLRALYNIDDRSSLSQDLLYTVAAENASYYQISSETAYNVKLPEIARGLGLKLAFHDDYDNTTTSPRKKNDTRLTLGVTFDF